MKHSVAIKFIAILLCALSLVSIIASGFGILYMENLNLYNTSLEEMKAQQAESVALNLALYSAQVHAIQSLSNCPPEIQEDVMATHNYYLENYLFGDYAVEIFQNGELVYTYHEAAQLGDYNTFEYTLNPTYPIVTYQYRHSDIWSEPEVTEAPLQTLPPSTLPYGADTPVFQLEPTSAAGDAAESSIEGTAILPEEASSDWVLARDAALELVEGQDVIYSSEHSENFYSDNGEEYWVNYILDYYRGPEYQVVVHLADSAVLGSEYALMSLLYPYRDLFIPALLVSLLIFAVTLVYLLAAAGHAKGGEICPTGLNRLPLDIYAAGAGAGITLLAALMALLLDNFGSGYMGIWDNLPLCMLILGSGSFSMALLAIGFVFAFVAQIKVGNGYWWRHSICGFVLHQVVAFFRWVRRGLRYFYRGCRAVVRLLPIIWQWLLTAFVMVFVLFITCLLTFHASYIRTNGFFFLLLLLEIAVCIGIVCYGAWCFGLLLKGAGIMSRGDLNYQIDTKYLFGCFKDFALRLNSLAGAAQTAADQRMKSERMKTELITNVSHDIKTPLTSIINYVDLMQKPHSEEDHAAYLDVLDRQSQRLKKLVEDLMDMSKASSGNMAVDVVQMDAVEAVNQALGEFADKLDAVNLTPVFRHPDTPVIIQADGRLVWRVLSNLLSNAVKYAMPDTRLYVDLMVLQDNAVIAIKNISRDQLNVNAEELMERFVRGDTSRNTEGSGLGLNIAKSLVELQKGQMHLMVDGDLFKVTLIFPLV